MYWVGLVLLGLGVVVLGFTNFGKFFEAIEGSFFDWSEVFWYLQWGGFWLVTLRFEGGQVGAGGYRPADGDDRGRAGVGSMADLTGFRDVVWPRFRMRSRG